MTDIVSASSKELQGDVEGVANEHNALIQKYVPAEKIDSFYSELESCFSTKLKEMSATENDKFKKDAVAPTLILTNRARTTSHRTLVEQLKTNNSKEL